MTIDAFIDACQDIVTSFQEDGVLTFLSIEYDLRNERLPRAYLKVCQSLDNVKEHITFLLTQCRHDLSDSPLDVQCLEREDMFSIGARTWDRNQQSPLMDLWSF